MNQQQVLHVQTDMTEEKRQEMEEMVVRLWNFAENRDPKNVAKLVKEQCDAQFGGNWNCHAGPRFGRYLA